LIKEIDFKTLRSFFDDKSFNTFKAIDFPKSKFYALYENNQITACCRALPTEWRIVKIAGFQGFILQNIIGKIPYLNRIFNSSEFNFMAIDFIHAQSSENLEKLLEHILWDNKRNIAISWLSKNDTRKIFFEDMNQGILEIFNSKVPANIICQYKNLSAEQINELTEKPYFICTNDLT
jgi:hypothetical protein